MLILQASDSSFFIKLVFATQGALFPIMALFLCVNINRYKEYLPLLIAGKIIGIVILFTWSIASMQNTSPTDFISEMALLCCDLFALAAILKIKKDVDNMDLIEDKMEEK